MQLLLGLEVHLWRDISQQVLLVAHSPIQYISLINQSIKQASKQASNAMAEEQRGESPTTVLTPAESFSAPDHADGEKLSAEAAVTTPEENVEESFDEIEAVRIKCDVEDDNDDLGLLGDMPVEMFMDGTEERNEQEEFQLQMAKEYFDTGLNYWTDSDLDNAMREFSQSLEIREDIRGRNDPETAKCYLWVGTIHFLQDEFDRALDDFYRCFRIQYEMADGNQDKCHVVSNWINKSLDAKGVKTEKEKDLYWKKFMTCIEQDQKGDSFKDSGKYDRAIDAYRTAVKFEYLRRHLNPAVPGRPLADCGDLYYKIGRCYHRQKNWDRAVVEYRQALVIFYSKYGQNHRHTIKIVERMVELILDMGYQESVATEYVESIPQSVRHEQTGDWLLDINKSPEAAIKEYEAALATENGYLGRTQVACAMLYYKLGKAHHKWNKSNQAVTYWVRAAGIFESVLGSQHKHTTSAMKMIRSVCSSTAAASASPQEQPPPEQKQS